MNRSSEDRPFTQSPPISSICVTLLGDVEQYERYHCHLDKLLFTSDVPTMKNKKLLDVSKSLFPVLPSPLNKLFRGISDAKTFPKGWAKFLLLPVTKKGYETICANYRGISSLQSFNEITLLLFGNHEHAVSHRGSYVNQILTLRRIREHRFKFRHSAPASFIESRAAPDVIDR